MMGLEGAWKRIHEYCDGNSPYDADSIAERGRLRTDVITVNDTRLDEIATLRARVEELERAAMRRFPMQKTHSLDAKDQRASVPWAVGVQIWDRYAIRYSGQTAERIAERGGFGNGEADELLPGWRKLADAIDNDTSRAEKAESIIEPATQALRCMEHFLPDPTLAETNRGEHAEEALITGQAMDSLRRVLAATKGEG